MSFNEDIIKIVTENGGAFCGFADFEYFGLTRAVSYGVKLSDFVLSQIEDAPTYTYFSHYRTANALLDRLSILVGNYIEKNGYRYMPIPASQTVNGHDSYRGEISHKKAAYLAGLGHIGKNSLFIHENYGSKVRLGTVITDMPLETGKPKTDNICKNCTVCSQACPAFAIYGKCFDPENPDADLLDRKACSDYMKKAFGHIGRGSVCGICIKNCPHNRLSGKTLKNKE